MEQASTDSSIVLIGPFPPFRGGISKYNLQLFRALQVQQADQQSVQDDVRSSVQNGVQDGGPVLGLTFSRQYPLWLYPGSSDREVGASPEFPAGVEATLDTLNPLSWMKTLRLIRAARPERVILPWWHVYFFFCFGFLLRGLRRSGIQTLLIVHNVMDHEQAGWKQWLNRLLFSWADELLVHTQAEERRLAQILPRAKVRVHPHPVYDQYPRSKSLERRAQRELLFFGFVRPYKGLDVLVSAIEAIEQLPEDVSVFVRVVGEWMKKDPTLRARLARLEELGRVEVVDRYLSDAESAPYFETADALVLPYRAVTGSGVLAVALHYDLPVIASRVGCFPEFVRDGENGLLFESGDAGQLRQAMVRGLDGLDLKQVQQSWATWREVLSWGRLAATVTHASKDSPAQNSVLPSETNL